MSDFSKFEEKMQAEGLSELCIKTFRRYFEQLVQGDTGYISGADITPVESLPDLETLSDYSAQGAAALDHTVVIKLNGGLGTSMGLDRAKTLLPARDTNSFLDVIVQQVLHLRKTHSCSIPLVLMNSFRTNADSTAAVQKFKDFTAGQDGIPVSFVQNKVPRILEQDLTPLCWDADKNLEWCPPGHGDLYTSLVETGILETLISKGYRYAFVSNGDNLGAVLDVNLLGYFAEHELPFLMEVADRTEADKKGGHLAYSKGGRLMLREAAQCPEHEREAFQDWETYRYFNTNSMWLSLPALKTLLEKHDNIPGLPLIRNSKTADPADTTTPGVFQLETAMGAAISLFDGAGAIRVPRTRFAPVKRTEDLLSLWSDNFILGDDWVIRPNPERTLQTIVIALDDRFYKNFDDFSARFPEGAPSLINCASLTVIGDVMFKKTAVLQSSLVIENSEDEQLVVG